MPRPSLAQLALTHHDFFSESNMQSNPARHVLVGFIAADGCIREPYSGQSQIVFNLCNKDKCILDQFNTLLAQGSRPIHEQIHTGSKIMTIPSNQLVADLSRFGIVPRKTLIMRLPKLEEPSMSYFLRGYYYGDGWIYGEKGRRRYGLVSNPLFISDVNDYLIGNQIIKSSCITKRNNNTWLLEVYGTQAIKLSNYWFKNNDYNLLPRKHKTTEAWSTKRGRIYN